MNWVWYFERGTAELSVSLSMSAIHISLNSFYWHYFAFTTVNVHRQLPTTETFQDKHLTIKRYCSPFPSIRCHGPMYPGKQRRGIQWYGQRERVTLSSLHTTSASSFDHHHSCLTISPLHLFTRGFRTFPSTKPLKLMTVPSVSPNQLKMFTNP